MRSVNNYENDAEGLAIHAIKCVAAIVAFVGCVVLTMTVVAGRKDVIEKHKPRWEITKSEPGHDSGFGYYQRKNERRR